MIKLLLELHMSKPGSDSDDRQADDKITININSMDPPKVAIDSTFKEV